MVTGGASRVVLTARTMTEVEGGRVEGTIRSKALVVREGALFSGQASIDLQDAPGEAKGFAYQEDELQLGYDKSVRGAADWYRSTLYGPTADPDGNGTQEPDAPRHVGARRQAESQQWEPPLPRCGGGANGSR